MAGLTENPELSGEKPTKAVISKKSEGPEPSRMKMEKTESDSISELTQDSEPAGKPVPNKVVTTESGRVSKPRKKKSAGKVGKKNKPVKTGKTPVPPPHDLALLEEVKKKIVWEEESSAWKCQLCGQSLKSRKAMNKHARQNCEYKELENPSWFLGWDKRTMSCLYCSEVFRKRRGIRRHLQLKMCPKLPNWKAIREGLQNQQGDPEESAPGPSNRGGHSSSRPSKGGHVGGSEVDGRFSYGKEYLANANIQTKIVSQVRGGFIKRSRSFRRGCMRSPRTSAGRGRGHQMVGYSHDETFEVPRDVMKVGNPSTSMSTSAGNMDMDSQHLDHGLVDNLKGISANRQVEISSDSSHTMSSRDLHGVFSVRSADTSHMSRPDISDQQSWGLSETWPPRESNDRWKQLSNKAPSQSFTDQYKGMFNEKRGSQHVSSDLCQSAEDTFQCWPPNRDTSLKSSKEDLWQFNYQGFNSQDEHTLNDDPQQVVRNRQQVSPPVEVNLLQRPWLNKDSMQQLPDSSTHRPIDRLDNLAGLPPFHTDDVYEQMSNNDPQHRYTQGRWNSYQDCSTGNSSTEPVPLGQTLRNNDTNWQNTDNKSVFDRLNCKISSPEAALGRQGPFSGHQDKRNACPGNDSRRRLKSPGKNVERVDDLKRHSSSSQDAQMDELCLDQYSCIDGRERELDPTHSQQEGRGFMQDRQHEIGLSSELQMAPETSQDQRSEPKCGRFEQRSSRSARQTSNQEGPVMKRSSPHRYEAEKCVSRYNPVDEGKMLEQGHLQKGEDFRRRSPFSHDGFRRESSNSRVHGTNTHEQRRKVTPDFSKSHRPLDERWSNPDRHSQRDNIHGFSNSPPRKQRTDFPQKQNQSPQGQSQELDVSRWHSRSPQRPSRLEEPDFQTRGSLSTLNRRGNPDFSSRRDNHTSSSRTDGSDVMKRCQSPPKLRRKADLADFHGSYRYNSPSRSRHHNKDDNLWQYPDGSCQDPETREIGHSRHFPEDEGQWQSTQEDYLDARNSCGRFNQGDRFRHGHVNHASSVDEERSGWDGDRQFQRESSPKWPSHIPSKPGSRGVSSGGHSDRRGGSTIYFGSQSSHGRGKFSAGKSFQVEDSRPWYGDQPSVHDDEIRDDSPNSCNRRLRSPRKHVDRPLNERLNFPNDDVSRYQDIRPGRQDLSDNQRSLETNFRPDDSHRRHNQHDRARSNFGDLSAEIASHDRGIKRPRLDRYTEREPRRQDAEERTKRSDPGRQDWKRGSSGGSSSSPRRDRNY